MQKDSQFIMPNIAGATSTVIFDSRCHFPTAYMCEELHKILLQQSGYQFALQCSDTVGWATRETGRASGM